MWYCEWWWCFCCFVGWWYCFSCVNWLVLVDWKLYLICLWWCICGGKFSCVCIVLGCCLLLGKGFFMEYLKFLSCLWFFWYWGCVIVFDCGWCILDWNGLWLLFWNVDWYWLLWGFLIFGYWFGLKDWSMILFVFYWFCICVGYCFFWICWSGW